MNVECMASRQGITPMMVRFMVRYKAATKPMEIRIERGITRSGWRTSPAKKHALL